MNLQSGVRCMMSRDTDEDVICKYCNNNTSKLVHPVYSGIEDKPFGSEMRYGRGVCDTDPIQSLQYKVTKPCGFGGNSYSKGSLVSVQYDFEKGKEIEKNGSNDPTNYIPPFGFRTLSQDYRKNSCAGSEKKLKEKLTDSCDKNSSEETSRSSLQNTPAMSSMRESMDRDHLLNDSKIAHKQILREERQGRDVKPAGPFTEPPNPGKQMKLGEPYFRPNRVKKDFYKDF